MKLAVNNPLGKIFALRHMPSVTGSGDEPTKARSVKSPWASPDDRRLIVHCCYHKAGTHWMKGILKRICERYEMNWDRIEHSQLFGEGPKTIQQALLKNDVLIDGHSRIDLADLPPYRGSHMVRDPRDMTISGYFYHLWSSEKWLHVAKPKFEGRTYQELLNSLNQEDGLIQEIERFSGSFRKMIEWDYNNPDIFELRYEELLTDEGTIYRKLFQHYGFNSQAVERGLRIAKRSSFEARAKRQVGTVQEKSVMRSGKPGQWRDYFTDPVKNRFKELVGDVLIELGYEKNNDW